MSSSSMKLFCNHGGGFLRYITSDCDAVAAIFNKHKYARSPEDAVADVLRAGMTCSCPNFTTHLLFSYCSCVSILTLNLAFT